jgi:phage gpG-like protein
VISVQIDDSAIQQLQQQLAGLAPRVVTQVYEALQPLIYQSLRTAVPKYFAGSASKSTSSDLLTSRSGNLLNSVLNSIQVSPDGQSLAVSIGSELPYARIHEYGGFAGRHGPYKKKDGHRSYIGPRPYLRPAINDLQRVLPDLLEQAIQQVQVSE